MESQNNVKIIDLAARKVFVRELMSASRASIKTQPGHQQQGKKVKEWLVRYHNKEVTISVVWIQGQVNQVKEQEDFILISDGTGTAKITGFTKLPFLSAKLETGQYIMAIAQLVSPGQCPQLRALKLQNLMMADKTSAERLWSLEVMDQLLHVP